MLQEKFNKIINKIFLNKVPKKIAVAVSGGIDSMSLTFLLNQFCKNKKIELIALTVDHNLRKNSAPDAKKTTKILQKSGISCYILNSYLETPPITNIEAILREVRYNLLHEYCLNNDIKYLFIGHHQQDLTENFLIRLFRGSGIDGLSATDYITDFQEIKIIRPLLDFKKEEFQEYLLNKKITWIEDESNQDEKYLRNKIRLFLNSLKDKDLINQRVAKASSSILENKKLIEKFLLENSSKILKFNELGYFLFNKDDFINLSFEEAKRYLAWSLMDVSGNYYKPRLQYLENLYFWILDKNKSQKKRSFYGCIIQEFNQSQFIIYREKSAIKEVELENNLIWDNRFKIDFIGSSNQIKVSNINASELNKLKIHHQMKGILKNILYTIPVLRKNNEILAIPHLNYYPLPELTQKIIVKFDKKTKL